MRVKTLAFIFVSLGLLLATWLLPFTRPFWNYLDHITYRTLNIWIAKSPFWQNFWAIWNHRIADWINDVVMLLVFYLYVRGGKKQERSKRIFESIFCVLLMTFVIVVINEYFIAKVINMHRKSPTLIVDNPIRLSKILDWIHVKDYSKKSFPGSHATTAFLFATVCSLMMNKRLAFFSCLYAIFFCLPRLVVGAHWLTDDLFGSAYIAIISVSLAFFTPLKDLFVLYSQRIWTSYKNTTRRCKS